jgi:hypothetical protein
MVADAIGVERDRLETETRFASSGIDAIVLQEVPRGYFTAAVLPQLHLCHLHVSVVLHSQVTWMLHFNVSVRCRCHRGNTLDCGRRPVEQEQPEYYGNRGLRTLHVAD